MILPSCQCRWNAFLNRYPGFTTSEEEMLGLMAMAHRLRRALLQHLGIDPQAILP